jgi:hypothetical protein
VTDLQIVVILIACVIVFAGYVVLCDRVRQ